MMINQHGANWAVRAVLAHKVLAANHGRLAAAGWRLLPCPGCSGAGRWVSGKCWRRIGGLISPCPALALALALALPADYCPPLGRGLWLHPPSPPHLLHQDQALKWVEVLGETERERKRERGEGGGEGG